MSHPLLPELQKVPALEHVPVSQLEWLIENGVCNDYTPGDLLFKKDEPIDSMIILLKGKFVFKLEQNNQFKVVANVNQYDITGLLPYSRATNATGYGEVVQPSTTLSLGRKYFEEMICGHHELTTALVHVMSSRIRDFTKKQQQDDKMMSLGKLSAGLAHELNNPSAAVVRSAQELKKHLSFLPEGFKRVIQIRTSEESVDAINQLLFSKIQESGNIQLSMMEKSSLEDDLMDWMEDNDIEDGDEIAEVLADFGFEEEDLEKVQSLLREEDLFPVLNWFAQVLTTEKLVNEIEEASRRIGSLVGSVKSYTHMDQSPERKPADIHVGIRNTLTMLNFKLKKGQVEVVEKFCKDLPKPKVFISELNQVWTNIIDNAIDAMEKEEKKILEIETVKDGNFVNINITDSGKGIPENVIHKIFDPFFTTKPVGKGTGLGLDVVHQIINQHGGMIEVDSKPGKTTFSIYLPIN